MDDTKVATEYVENMSSRTHELGYSEDDARRGALILEEEGHLTLWQTAKYHWRALMICESIFGSFSS